VIEEALTSKLLSDTGVVGLVADRVSWTQRRQGDSLPAIVLTSVSSINQYADEGFVGLRFTRVQIDCWAADDQGSAGATGAIMLARAVRAALANVSMTALGVEFQGVFPAEDGTDTAEQGLAGIVEYRRRLEFELWTTETLGG
jgi:hypothetical protein